MKLTTDQVVVERYGGHLVIVLTGEFDAGNVGMLAGSLSTAMAPETSTVQMELQGADYLDSSALRALLDFRRLASERSVEVRIGSASPIVRRLLEIVQLEELFGQH
jgi:anti-anti-sigma factor